MSVYVIAGIGGDLGELIKLISAAKAAGADAVRFHSLHADELAHEMFAADQHGRLRRLELSREQHFELAGACHDAGIDFVGTAFDFEAVDLLCELNAPAIRIASGDATNLPLIGYAARQQKPLFISTGMCSLAEAGDAYYCALEEGSPRVVVLHTSSTFPTPLEEVNLQALATLAGELFCEVGYSDHSIGCDCCLGAAALGATVIEKHLRLRPSTEFPHEATPEQFADLVSRLRAMDIARGDGDKRRMAGEAENTEQLRRSVFYRHGLPAGHVITWVDLAFLRPVVGLSPAEAYRFVGRTLGVDMQAGELASEQDIAVVELKGKPEPVAD